MENFWLRRFQLILAILLVLLLLVTSEILTG
ncbi:hypothetical protein Ga0123462_1362 [Mariprofundus ferrinatatus]|uniref:Uncharacterized protein n=1 Tax=Mariprofundus ferrinatatus TaxID=1921087 RepID=A0A2K8L4H2_9PROT|nr:hypothetical protein Ga0123462_1362 [Mariprofundus ferrinatatus]